VAATGIVGGEEEEIYLLHVSIQLDDHHQGIFMKFTTRYSIIL
jgi:hypothetical protein